MLVTVVLLGLTAVAAATDFIRQKIYNWTTYTGILAALILNAAGSAWVAARGSDAAGLERLGWIGLRESFLGLAVCGGLMLVCFVMFQVRGGDVKLMAMLGALLGWNQGIEAMLWTFVLGGCMGLVILVWRVGPVRLVGRVTRQLLWTLRLGRWSPLDPDERALLQQRLFLAPSAFAAAWLVRFPWLLTWLG